jgi:hypothetical protein
MRGYAPHETVLPDTHSPFRPRNGLRKDHGNRIYSPWVGIFSSYRRFRFLVSSLRCQAADIIRSATAYSPVELPNGGLDAARNCG